MDEHTKTNQNGTKMDKFNSFVDFMLEVDTTMTSQGAPTGGTQGGGTGRDFIIHILNQVPEQGNLKRDLENKIINSSDPSIQTTLGREIERPEDLSDLISLIDTNLKLFTNSQDVENKARQVAATGSAENDIEPSSAPKTVGSNLLGTQLRISSWAECP